MLIVVDALLQASASFFLLLPGAPALRTLPTFVEGLVQDDDGGLMARLSHPPGWKLGPSLGHTSSHAPSTWEWATLVP